MSTLIEDAETLFGTLPTVFDELTVEDMEKVGTLLRRTGEANDALAAYLRVSGRVVGERPAAFAG